MTAELHVAKSAELSQEASNGDDGVADNLCGYKVVEQMASSTTQDIPAPEAAAKQTAPSALEQLAKNLDEMSNHKPLLNDVNQNDIIAFKVFMPTFELSEYIIGMVESFERNNAINEGDFEITLLIMGKYNIFFNLILRFVKLNRAYVWESFSNKILKDSLIFLDFKKRFPNISPETK